MGIERINGFIWGVNTGLCFGFGIGIHPVFFIGVIFFPLMNIVFDRNTRNTQP